MKKILLASVLSLTLSACVSAPMQVTNADIPQSQLKYGKSCNSYLFGIIPLMTTQGNTIYNAKRDANISQVASVDTSFKWWIIGTSSCTIVEGK